MENKWRKKLFIPVGKAVYIMRHLTSWYIAPIWGFMLPYFSGESIYLCIGVAVANGLIGYKVWADYNTEDDGQITIEELKNSSKDDLTE